MSKTYLSLALLAGLSLSSSLLAQPWEKAYGPSASQEAGHRRVAQVTQCPGGGFIAIGTREVGAVSQVYLIRTSLAGLPLWEHYYDVGFDGQADEGLSLVEARNGSGFVTTGSSQIGLQQVAHLLKVDCNGGILFSRFYFPQFSTISTRFVGNDIREAVVGNNLTTFPGDLLIAGYIESPNGIGDAILLRVDAVGNLVWNLRYDTGATEKFFGLTEARANVVGGGDVIAVGDWRDTGRTQALVARVDGNTGNIAGGNQCMALYGDVGSEDFQSVVELRLGSTGDLAMAGLSSSPGQSGDVYLVQTQPNPCLFRAQTTIGNELGLTYRELATDLIEVTQAVDPGLGVPLGSLALTGYAESFGSIGDAFLLFAQQGSLQPITARIYGDHGGAVDYGSSLSQLRNTIGPIGQPRGFIIAGTTQTDWDGTADPQDLYLVQPNAAARTGCEADWLPFDADWRWEPRRVLPLMDKLLDERRVDTDGRRDDTVVRVCQ